VAELTQTKVNTVRDRLQAGRRKLRKSLARDANLRRFARIGRQR